MRIGTDIIEIDRIKEVIQRKPDFPKRILSDAELKLYQSYMTQERKHNFIAGRFSAKEAYGKALGIGVGTLLKFRQITILPDCLGAPQVVAGPIVSPQVQVSISHSRDNAIASVLIDLEETQIIERLDKFLNGVEHTYDDE